MNSVWLPPVCAALMLFPWAAAVAGAAPSWSLRDGERVVMLGDAFVEREGDRGFVEAALVAAHPEATLQFRNLGWSGDTVWAESRGVFDPPEKGYDRMVSLVRELRPTTIIVAYGRNESFQGAAGLAAFRAQLAKLCDDLRAAADEAAPLKPQLVLVTPHPFEPPPAAAGKEPAADGRNASLAAYSQTIRDVAAEKQAGLVDLFARLPADAPAGTPLTENGSHLTDAGNAQAARAFVAACGRSVAADFADRSEELRGLVVAKNKLFFHRWRPANETYIFLFRKHEQGNNAVEIPQFDPLVEEAERKVRALARRPAER